MGIALFRGLFFLFPFNRGQPFDVLSVFLVTLSAVEGSFERFFDKLRITI